MVAAEQGQAATVRVLAKLGASINAVNHWGNTALHFAMRSSGTELVSMFLEYGSDPMIST